MMRTATCPLAQKDGFMEHLLGTWGILFHPSKILQDSNYDQPQFTDKEMQQQKE